MYPEHLKYTKDHEWLQLSADEGVIGITDYAQQQLGDVVYVDLPEVGARVERGAPFGSIESVKAVSELYSPVTGEVVRVNSDLDTHPETINQAPHETWIIAVKISDPTQLEGLLDSAQYSALIA